MVSVSCGYLDKKMAGADPASAFSHIHKITPTYYPHLVNVKYSKMLKEVLHIPVSVVGAIMTPEFVRLLGRVFEITSTDAFKQCDCIIDEDKEDFNG